jgi:hypothetical protein
MWREKSLSSLESFISFFRGKVVRRQMGKWGNRRGGDVTHEGNTGEEKNGYIVFK